MTRGRRGPDEGWVGGVRVLLMRSQGVDKVERGGRLRDASRRTVPEVLRSGPHSGSPPPPLRLSHSPRPDATPVPPLLPPDVVGDVQA